MSNFDAIIPYKFHARDYQIPFLYRVEQAINKEITQRYFIQMWHRRAGKDKTNIADIAPRRLVKDPCLVKYIYPTLVMGRDNMWTGIGSDGFPYLGHLPTSIRAGKPDKTRMTMPILCDGEPDENGDPAKSLFQVAGSDNPDSLRGGNAKLNIFSEWSEHDPYAWDVIEPILVENDGVAIFNFTPKGENHAQALLKYARSNPELWHVDIKTVLDTQIFSPEKLKQIQENIINRFEANGRSADEAIAYYEQEYMCSFNASVVGAYYGAAMRRVEDDKRIGNVPYETSLPVHTAWDLGMDDSMTIWFFQEYAMEIRIIDYYESSGEGLPHYAQVLQSKKYIYGRHYMPHDIQVRELTNGKSRFETAKSLGIWPIIVAPRLDVDEGIEAVRSILSRCWFDKTKAKRGVDCLKNYTKDWDEKNKVFRNRPKHNWASHGSDAFRTFATGHKRKKKSGGSVVVTGTGGVGWD